MMLLLVVLALTTAVFGDDLTCDGDYTRNGDYCYKLMSAVNSIADADQHCVAKGGNIASIHSQPENDFIASFGAEVFIGLRYNPQAGIYSWTDGTPLDIQIWEENYPMNPEFLGNCVKMLESGKWINFQCNWKAQYVCKKAASSLQCPVRPDNQFFNSGEVTSPGYPGNYISGLSCTYIMLVKNNESVKVVITEMTMGAGDTIEIFSGLVPNNDYRIAVLTGHLTGKPKIFTTPQAENSMIVRFASKSQTGGYWKFNFEPVGSSFHCPVQPNNQFFGSGELASPGYPGNYISGLSCTYALSVNSNYIVKVETSANELGTGDIIEAFNGLVANFANRIEVLDGNSGLKTFTTSGTEKRMLLKFTSKSLTGGSWKLNFHPIRVCENGWISGGENGLNYCYEIDKTEVLLFEKAESKCEREGGHLISIQNAFQNRFVTDNVIKKGCWVWLGLFYENGYWQWTDGSAVRYTNWQSGQPNIDYGKCATIGPSGQWKSESCIYSSLYTACYKP